MSRGDFGYDSVRPYRDEPDPTQSRTNPFDSPTGGGYQGSDYDQFSELVDTISNNIFTINNNGHSLDKAMRQIGTKTDCVKLRNKIHSTEQNTNHVINDTVATLRRLAKVVPRSDRNKKVQQDRLTGEFQEAVTSYSKLQKKVAEKVKSAVVITSHQNPDLLVDLDDEASDEARLLQQEERRAQMMAQEEQVEVEVALLEEREHHIIQLESDIIDINAIFQELGTMVHEQGIVIDTIEDNVEKAGGNVEAGNEQLNQASIYQSRARRKKCILIGILLVIAAVIALIIGLSVKHK